jgi:hypothetical protein
VPGKITHVFTMEEVRTRFDEWRQNRRGKARIPDELWSAAMELEADPFSGWLFIFRSRRGTAIKLLCWDGQGFWLATKRLSTGRFISDGGRRALNRREHCAHIRRNCSWRPVIQRLKRRLHGGR